MYNYIERTSNLIAYINMENSTFCEGIAPGGLREQPEIKLLICYLLKALDKPLTRTQINEILQEYRIANYFEINGAISELVNGGQVASEIVDGDEVVSITSKSKIDVARIERSLPKSIREKAVKAALKILTRDRIKKESKVEIEKLEHGFHVTFTILDVETELLKITLYVADERQIEIVKENFFNNAVGIYSNIISSLTVE